MYGSRLPAVVAPDAAYARGVEQRLSDQRGDGSLALLPQRSEDPFVESEAQSFLGPREHLVGDQAGDRLAKQMLGNCMLWISNRTGLPCFTVNWNRACRA